MGVYTKMAGVFINIYATAICKWDRMKTNYHYFVERRIHSLSRVVMFNTLSNVDIYLNDILIGDLSLSLVTHA